MKKFPLKKYDSSYENALLGNEGLIYILHSILTLFCSWLLVEWPNFALVPRKVSKLPSSLLLSLREERRRLSDSQLFNIKESLVPMQKSLTSLLLRKQVKETLVFWLDRFSLFFYVCCLLNPFLARFRGMVGPRWLRIWRRTSFWKSQKVSFYFFQPITSLVTARSLGPFKWNRLLLWHKMRHFLWFSNTV